MARLASVPVVALTLGGLAACAPGAVKTQRDLNRSYDHMNFMSYHQGRDTRVIVLGDTFGLDANTFGDRVTAAMQGQHWGRPTNFTTRPGPSATKEFRVVMAFNVEPVHYGLCTDQKLAPRVTPGETVLQAAWCWQDRTESYVRSWTATTRPDDPGFRALVAQTTYELFPPHMNEELIRDNGDNDDFP